MYFHSTIIPDVFLIEPIVHEDIRGFFVETYQKKEFIKAGISYDFVQDNQSSSLKGTLRGIHYQISCPQGKLIRVVIGEVFDVAVDLRRSSPTFGKWVGKELSAGNKMQLWTPPGIGHGFLTLSETAEVIYKATDFYSPENERSIRWNDPTIGIEWPIDDTTQILLSEKDRKGAYFVEAEVFP